MLNEIINGDFEKVLDAEINFSFKNFGREALKVLKKDWLPIAILMFQR